jgi:hypothetical protein
LNENYGRELLELHTLGVDGGYTQKDVIEVARAFTGWTIDRDGSFRFVDALHDPGEKSCSATRSRQAAASRTVKRCSTSWHRIRRRHTTLPISSRSGWCRRTAPCARRSRRGTVPDNPAGDLREVVRTIVTSPEFLDASARDAKFKTPLRACRERDADHRSDRERCTRPGANAAADG